MYGLQVCHVEAISAVDICHSMLVSSQFPEARPITLLEACVPHKRMQGL